MKFVLAALSLVISASAFAVDIGVNAPSYTPVPQCGFNARIKTVSHGPGDLQLRVCDISSPSCYPILLDTSEQFGFKRDTRNAMNVGGRQLNGQCAEFPMSERVTANQKVIRARLGDTKVTIH